MESKQDFPTFFNFKNVQMIAPTTPGNTVNLAQIDSDKQTIQYIAQPFTSYGQSYTLVNPVQLSSGQNGQIVINKPNLTNTISNISFKCDVCSQIFPHLTLLNQHKRTHNQDDSHSDTVTVVTQNSGGQLIQAQNLISESGQNLGQIQIVAAESLEPAQLHHTIGDQIGIVQQQQKGGDKNKCVSCGGHIQQSTKRKGPKLIRCETCIQNDANGQNVRPTQIFVSPDGDIKFEMNQDQSPVIQVQNVIQPKQPAKKKNVTTVTKCTTCNGTGVIVVTEIPSESTTTVGSGTKMNATATTRNVVTQSQHQQKIQQVQIQQIKAPPPPSPEPVIQHYQQPQQHHQVQHHAPPANQVGRQAESDKPFTCGICGGKFSRYSSLWSHKKLHSGEKNYKCEQCSASFAKAVYLKNHMRIHSGEKPYRCSTCGMTFSQSPHLKNHERTHTGEKPYVCQICDKGFARHATLWNHRRIHTGEKPYKCERCNSAFSQAAHLKNHEKVHLGIKPYKCNICAGSFSDKFALKRHTNIHQKYGQTIPLHAVEEEHLIDESDMKEEGDDDEKDEDELILA